MFLFLIFFGSESKFYHRHTSSVDEAYQFIKDCQADLLYNYGQSSKRALKSIELNFAYLEYDDLNDKYSSPNNMVWRAHRSSYEDFDGMFSDKKLIENMFKIYSDYYNKEN